MNRVISLIPSGTEIVCALGCEAELVGRSHECDYPPTVRQLPAVSAPRIDVTADSRTIDQQLAALLKKGQGAYTLDVARLVSLEPTHVVTQEQCEVCAVSEAEVRTAIEGLPAPRPELITLSPTGLDAVFQDIQRVANALGVITRGRTLRSGLRQRIADIEARTRDLTTRPRVACIEWLAPMMVAGLWMPVLVDKAGGRSLFSPADGASPALEWDQLREEDPDVIILMPCGMDIHRTRRELPAMVTDPKWPSLKAVREERVYVADGNQYMNRPGPRLIESLEIVAEILHPELFTFHHRGVGFEPL